MESGDMLKKLHEAEEALFELLSDGTDAWEGLDVNYEPPHVERLWRQWGEYRISLHRIYPCEKALCHPHPWASAVRILSGQYEMGIGFTECGEQEEIARLVLVEGSEYEMLSEPDWHYVKPLRKPCLSVMVTAPPFNSRLVIDKKFGKGIEHNKLSEPVKTELLITFLNMY